MDEYWLYLGIGGCIVILLLAAISDKLSKAVKLLESIASNTFDEDAWRRKNGW